MARVVTSSRYVKHMLQSGGIAEIAKYDFGLLAIGCWRMGARWRRLSDGSQGGDWHALRPGSSAAHSCRWVGGDLSTMLIWFMF